MKDNYKDDFMNFSITTERTPAKHFNVSIRELDYQTFREKSSIENFVDNLMTARSRPQRHVRLSVLNL